MEYKEPLCKIYVRAIRYVQFKIYNMLGYSVENEVLAAL